MRRRPGRRPIATYVSEYDDALVREAIDRELERGGRCFFVHNRVENIERAAERLRGWCRSLRIGSPTGRCTSTSSRRRCSPSSHGEIDVLVCTTIIESGLDIPNANTIVVKQRRPSRPGQLYQIRGRVGPRGRARLRLPAVPTSQRSRETRRSACAGLFDDTELGAGFRIAMRDLEIRGAGNLLGDEQSGHMAAVGFDLYLEMLNDAVMQGQGVEPPEQETRVEIAVSAYIPSEYVPLEAAKIDLHRRMAMASSLEDVGALRDEIEDRFGPVPPPVEALLSVQRVRVKLRAAGATQIAVRSGRVVVGPVSLTSAALRALREQEPRASYSGSERLVSLPAPSLPSERLEAAEAALDALAGAAAVAA